MSQSHDGEPSQNQPSVDDARRPFAGEEMDPARAFAELGAMRLGENDLRDVLSRIAHLAKATIRGTSEASVTLVADEGAGTAAYTGQLALAMDERQYDEGRGPCLDASADPTNPRLIPDARHEQRWPAYAQAARAAGVGSSMSVGIPVVAQLNGALNVYSTEVGSFDDEAVALAESFAGYAAVAMANAHLYETTSTLAAQMAEAMASRAVIEQAKGILIAQQSVTADEAFAMLSRASQTSNRKVRDIAQAIVDGAQGGRKR